MFSSQDGTWRTPLDLFKQLNEEFHFDLDVCASNAWLLPKYLSDNALQQDWCKIAKSCFMNPPYGREIGNWILHAFIEAKVHQGCSVVCLLPARTDTDWFWRYCTKGEIRFLKGRLKFLNPNYTTPKPAPFPSMIVVFRP